MGCPDRMGALTDRKRRASLERKTRILSPASDLEFGHRNKRFRHQQEESTFHLPSSFADSRLCWSESKAKTNPKIALPPPSPLKRAVQGPHRRNDFRKTRVSTLSDLDKELEQEWAMEKRCYQTSNFKSLESYKKRIDALQTKFAYINGNHHGFDRAGVAIQEEGVAIDSDRGGITIEDERVEGATYSGRIESNGRGIVIDIGHASFTPVVVADVETNSDRESEKKEVKPPEEGGLLCKGKVAERDFESVTDKLEALHFTEAKSKEMKPVYKQMHEKVVRERNFKLECLDLEIALAVTKLVAIQSTKAIYKEKQDDKEIHLESEKQVALRYALAPLEDKAEADVADALRGRKRQEVLVMHNSSNIEITRQTLQCLMPGAWLNDEVINLYFELLKEREKRDPAKFLKCHFFNTFFYKKLFSKAKYDYKAVRRWTTPRKIGYSLIDCDKIFVPIHREIHWCLAIIDIRAKKFQYLDSLKGKDTRVLQVLAEYIVDEAKDKNDQDLDVSDWEKEFIEDLPAQENGWDCGVFMIKYADFHSQDLPLSFSQADMPYFRMRTAKEILELRAEFIAYMTSI